MKLKFDKRNHKTATHIICVRIHNSFSWRIRWDLNLSAHCRPRNFTTQLILLHANQSPYIKSCGISQTLQRFQNSYSPDNIEVFFHNDNDGIASPPPAWRPMPLLFIMDNLTYYKSKPFLHSNLRLFTTCLSVKR